MAKYTTTKQLIKAVPTVREEDGVVTQWEIEVRYEHEKEDGTKWARAYPHTENVEYLNQKLSDFTKAGLIALMPSNMDTIFDAHYDAHNSVATESKKTDFKLSDLL